MNTSSILNTGSKSNHNRKNIQTAGNIIRYILLTFAAFCFLMPIMWFITSSFRTNQEVFANLNPFSLKLMFFGNYSLNSYISLFMKYEFYRPVFNTILVCALTIVLGIFFASMAGYAFAKMRFAGRKTMFLLVIFAIMVPFDAIAIPLYSIIGKLNWINTYQALIIPTLANGLVIFMFKQFFMDVNDSLIESARIDGANEFLIFFRIIFPISKPTIISGALILFMAQWNAFMWPLLCARTPNLRMVQVALSDFQTEFGTNWSEQFAGMTISLAIPCMILMPFQKYYIRGIATSGIKE